MRLTLRNMLAYLDGILDAEARQEIGKRIEESEKATSLLHHIQDVMRRIRLGAPSITDPGEGLDPNTVAEYLDHTLPHERVPDFEKVCLDSDIHLAEVASCHQILALVLGEPAEVQPETRRRIYRLPHRLAEKAKSEAAMPESGEAPVIQVSTPHKPVVPDYLRETRHRRLWPWVVVLAIVVFLSITSLLVLERFRPNWPSVAPRNSPAPTVVASQGQPVTPAPSPSPLVPPVSSTAVPVAAATSTATSPAPPPPAAGPPQSPSSSPSPHAAELLPSNPSSSPSSIATAVSAPVAGATVPGVPPEGPAVAAGSGTPAPVASGAALATDETPAPSGPPATDSSTTPSAASASQSLPPASQPAAEQNPLGEASKSQAAPPALPETIGQLASAGEIVLRALDPASSAWDRLPDKSTLMSQDILLSLPAFRPGITLTSGPQLQLVDDTLAQLLPSDADGVSGVAVRRGRMVITTTGQAGRRLRLQVGELAGMVTFTDADSVLAIEVGRNAGSNQDPETQPVPFTVDLMAVTGRIHWQDTAGTEPMAINPPVRLTLNGGMRDAVSMKQTPEWITSDTTTTLDRLACQFLREAIVPGRPPVLSLRELAEHRREEVRRLALRCLSAIGDFDLLVASLDNREQWRDWPERIEQLRAAVTRDPSAAAQVRSAMERAYRNEGAAMYELLWRYNNVTQLSPTDADHLVKCLEHDALALRVLSFWNLNRITGLGFFYRPEDPAAKRQQAVSRWRERLKDGFSGRTPDRGSLPMTGEGKAEL